MNSIRAIVQDALQSCHLSLEAENRLRNLMQQPYDRDDFRAIMRLQQECLAGRVRQQSRDSYAASLQLTDDVPCPVAT